MNGMKKRRRKPRWLQEEKRNEKSTGRFRGGKPRQAYRSKNGPKKTKSRAGYVTTCIRRQTQVGPKGDTKSYKAGGSGPSHRVKRTIHRATGTVAWTHATATAFAAWEGEVIVKVASPSCFRAVPSPWKCGRRRGFYYHGDTENTEGLGEIH